MDELTVTRGKGGLGSENHTRLENGGFGGGERWSLGDTQTNAVPEATASFWAGVDFRAQNEHVAHAFVDWPASFTLVNFTPSNRANPAPVPTQRKPSWV